MVQFDESLLNLGIDPGIFAVIGIFGAGGNHPFKPYIAGHPKSVLADCFGERARNMQSVQRQYRAPFRFHPENVGGTARIGHGKITARISTQQQVKINGHGAVFSWHLLSRIAPAIAIAYRSKRQSGPTIALSQGSLCRGSSLPLIAYVKLL